MNLSIAAQTRARAFIMQHARPLEQALYRHFFEGAPATAVLAELLKFQNADGGFGHGLEPDLRLPASSVLATTVALQHLRELGAGAGDPLAQAALRYLLASYDPTIAAWPIIPSSVSDAPHAPWWAYNDQLADRWRGFLANPRAEITGYLFDYPSLAPAVLREQMGEATAAYLEAPIHELEMHDILCYVRLVETRSLPPALRARLLAALAPVIQRSVGEDVAAWAEYGLKPLQVAGSPASPFASRLAGAVEANLDYEIERQGPDGAWAPNWSWFGLYDVAWPQAEREWKGVLTVRTLRCLQCFGRWQ